MKTLRDFAVKNKRVLVRCDFNVPTDENGNVSDDFRIGQTLPTIKYLLKNKAKVILMSHFGEPRGQVVPELKLDKVAEKLSELLGILVKKENDCVGPEVLSDANNLKPGEILLLENLRFHKEETENNPEFSKKLAEFGDIYINDAFSVCHRNHASVSGIVKFLPHGAGFLFEKEIENLNKVLENPVKPMISIIGGTKVETKSKFIDKISEVSDFVLISGLLKKEVSDKNIQFKYPEKIIGPEDNLNALDINDKSIKLFEEKILKAKTILWNGPFGKFEDEKYSAGTLAIAKAIIKSKAFSVAGGGETVEFLRKQGIIEKFSHVSTGGGAMMAYLSGEKLPGLEALCIK